MNDAIRVEQLIDEAAAARPEHVALVCGGRRWTYRQLQAERDRRAGLLVEAGLQPGTIVVTAERFTDDHVLSFLACCQAGAALASLPPPYTASERQRVTARLQPQLAFTADGAGDPALIAPQSLPITLPGSPGMAAVAEAKRRSQTGTADDLATIRTTSTTTKADPKLVMRPHRQMTWWRDFQPWWAQTDLVTCCPLRDHFNAGDLAYTFGRQGTLVIHSGAHYDLEGLLAAERVTAVQLVPALAALLVQQTATPPLLPHLAVIRTVAAALPAEIRAALTARYGVPIIEEYMLAKCQPVCSPQDRDTPAGSVGQPLPGNELRLLDANGEPVTTGAIGEVIIRSPGMMRGYLGDPATTVTVLRDGWFHTGDLAQCDAAGRYFLLDRRSLQINVGGYKVTPEEVEQVLRTHPGAREVVILPMPHPILGEAVRAVIVPQGTPPDAQALRRYCRQALAGYKVPRQIDFRDELPRSTLGKVLRHQL